jgi:predicted lipoprotein with Yx(FWY)xxD motif
MNMKNTRNLLALALFVAATGCSDDKASNAPDAAVSDASQTATTVSLSTAGTLGAHLVDKDNKALYFYVPDVAKSTKSACDTDCVKTWPVFNAPSPTVGDGLTAADFGSITRTDGSSQTTWKGRPLYYFATDTAGTTAGEAKGGIWFVARAYNVFFAADATVTPAGATIGKPFLTNGAGISLYVFKTDTRGVSGADPTSACTAALADCVTKWPVWEKPATLTNVVLPSTIPAADVTAFTNPNATKLQFVYKGWPTYFWHLDIAPGQVAGASVAPTTWFAVAPGFNGPLP